MEGRKRQIIDVHCTSRDSKGMYKKKLTQFQVFFRYLLLFRFVCTGKSTFFYN